MSPTIVEFFAKNTIYYSLGAIGGSHIITAITQCLWNVLDRNMSLVEAMAEPRYHDQLLPDHVEFEWAYNNKTILPSWRRLSIMSRGRTEEVQYKL